MPNLSTLDRMIDQTVEYRKKHNLVPVCFIIPGWGFGCIDIQKEKAEKEVVEVNINGIPIKILSENHPDNPLKENKCQII